MFRYFDNYDYFMQNYSLAGSITLILGMLIITILYKYTDIE